MRDWIGPMGDADVRFRFWGVRGSLPSPGPDTVVYGGDTPCVEITTASTRVIIDCGSGIRRLGNAMMEEPDDRETFILLGHPHFDHVCGLPFFTPIFIPGQRFRLGAVEPHDMRLLMPRLFCRPFFPVEEAMLGSEIEYFQPEPSGRMKLNDDVAIVTRPLNHPGGCTGYRVETGGVVIAYCSDTEHIEGETDRNVLDLMDGANLAIYDSAYTSAEYPNHVGWGHSTPDEGVRLAEIAGVKQLALFHHNPTRSDAQIAEIERRLQETAPFAFAGRDGMQLVFKAAKSKAA
ncbi:MBL fold metallo-hydrolase [Pikeienuella piscinae]|uniref:MBL fold metallo-hydrolase n=1 Tax=Pikeienuella piscinae TaxID=2748098 RepID=A0A7L5BU90_9RHOB|nr:MBL fold metallo-hydrolase [Pikeienuella piscinae]QIE54781.1 MBL fold metallo-hydrolase [Pikeienuella piscinae]